MRNKLSYSGDMMRMGEENEERIIRYLEKKKIVRDVRLEKAWQDVEVDCIVEEEDKEILYEIKADSYLGRSGNVLFETQRIYHDSHTAKPGWGWRSEADYLVVRNPSSGLTRVFDLPLLRAMVHEYLVQGEVKVKLVPSDDAKTTVNLLIPEELLEYKELTVP